VFYARYSDDLQRAESIADQFELCRRYADQQGWEIVGQYDDAAQSGGSRFFRSGFARLLADAEARRFDVVVCESIDRLGRRLADVADFYDRLTFWGVRIHATSLGTEITQMHIGIFGTIAQMTLIDLRSKTRRGQLGRARAGRIPGGLAYGYDVVPQAPGSKDAGERRIRADEAEVVRRIFREYVGGRSARHIARTLNEEGVPGPGGRPWIDTTIRGQVDRGTGILNNAIYKGELTWNRCSYVKDPRTGRRVARVNDAQAHEVVAVPALRIIDDATWAAAKARQTEMRIEIGRTEEGQPLNRAHRRVFLLSGLLTCSCCGGGYTIIGKDRYGCATRRGRGTCDNSQTITRQHIEARVLGGLRERLLTPEHVQEFVRAFAEALAADERQSGARRNQLERQLAETERGLQALVRAIENGAWSDTVQKRLAELEARKAEVKVELDSMGKPSPPPRLHPNAADIYAAAVADLEAALNDPGIRTEAAEVLRGLVEKIVLTPDADAPDGLAAALHGDLAQILTLAIPAPASASRAKGSGLGGAGRPGTPVRGSQLSVVAGAGFEPAAFRL
jgi:DNA invertase Pin-like site-specific DNA recombinase